MQRASSARGSASLISLFFEKVDELKEKDSVPHLLAGRKMVLADCQPDFCAVWCVWFLIARDLTVWSYTLREPTRALLTRKSRNIGLLPGSLRWLLLHL